MGGPRPWLTLKSALFVEPRSIEALRHFNGASFEGDIFHRNCGLLQGGLVITEKNTALPVLDDLAGFIDHCRLAIATKDERDLKKSGL